MKHTVLLLLLFSTPVWAQTTVTGTVTDPDSQTWNNGTFSVQLQPVSGFPGPYYFNGSVVQTNYPSAALSGSGTFSISLPPNGQMSSVGSTWVFTFCPNASAKCQSLPGLAVSGASQNISAFIAANLSALRFTSANNAYGYLDIEASAVVAGQYFNVTTGLQRQYTGSAWQTVGGGGGSSAFSAITSGTNTSATMNCGAGCILTPTSTGLVNANEINLVQMSTLATGPLCNTTTTGAPFACTSANAYPGTAALAINISTSGTANQVWGMNSGGSAQGWQTISAGGGTVTHTTGALTSGHFILGNGSGDIAADPNIDDGQTTVGVITSTEPIAINASGNGISAVEGAAPSGVAASDLLWPDSTAHRWVFNPNNAGALEMVGIAAAGTSGHLAILATNGIDITDGGAVPTSATCTSTCVVASSPGLGIAHFAGSTQTVTSSAVNLAGADVTGVLPAANVATGTSGATIPLNNGNNTASGNDTFSGAGAASTSSVQFTGTVFTGGNGTTTFPNVYINQGAAPTGFSTAGTEFGINAPSGFTGVLFDLWVNGAHKLQINNAGTIALNQACIQSLTTSNDGLLCFQNAGPILSVGTASIPGFIINNTTATPTANLLSLQIAGSTVSGANAQGGLFQPATAATLTPGTSVTSTTCATAACTAYRGSITIVGGTATTGTIATVSWTATPTIYVCTVIQNGSATSFGIGHSVATTTGFNITAAVSVVSATLTVDYQCQP